MTGWRVCATATARYGTGQRIQIRTPPHPPYRGRECGGSQTTRDRTGGRGPAPGRIGGRHGGAIRHSAGLPTSAEPAPHPAASLESGMVYGAAPAGMVWPGAPLVAPPGGGRRLRAARGCGGSKTGSGAGGRATYGRASSMRYPLQHAGARRGAGLLGGRRSPPCVQRTYPASRPTTWGRPRPGVHTPADRRGSGGVPGRIPDGAAGDPLPYLGDVCGGSVLEWPGPGARRLRGAPARAYAGDIRYYGVPPGRPYGVRYRYGILCGALGAAPRLWRVRGRMRHMARSGSTRSRAQPPTVRQHWADPARSGPKPPAGTAAARTLVWFVRGTHGGIPHGQYLVPPLQGSCETRRVWRRRHSMAPPALGSGPVGTVWKGPERHAGGTHWSVDDMAGSTDGHDTVPAPRYAGGGVAGYVDAGGIPRLRATLGRALEWRYISCGRAVFRADPCGMGCATYPGISLQGRPVRRGATYPGRDASDPSAPPEDTPYARPAVARALRPHGGMAYWYGATSGRRPSGISHTSWPPPGRQPSRASTLGGSWASRPPRTGTSHTCRMSGRGAGGASRAGPESTPGAADPACPAAGCPPHAGPSGAGSRPASPGAHSWRGPSRGRPRPARRATSSGPGWRGPPPARSPSCVWTRRTTITAPGWRCAAPPSCRDARRRPSTIHGGGGVSAVPVRVARARRRPGIFPRTAAGRLIGDPGRGPFKPPPGRRRELIAPLAAAWCRIYIADNHDMMPRMPSLGDPSLV